MTKFVKAINWNRLEDSLDKDVWDKVWANTWIDTKIPLSGDIETWETMTEEEKTATKKVLGGLTLLDTVQSEIGVPAIIPHALTPHEAAVLTQFTSMECFTGDHELLTPNGWVPIESVKKGDLIAQFHPETETVDFAPVVETSKHYAEETYEIKKGRYVSLRVSGNHRLLYSKEIKGVRQNVEHLAKDIVEKPTYNLMRFYNSGESTIQSDNLTVEDRLLVAMQADGSFDNSTLNPDGGYRRSGLNTGHVPCNFTISKSAKIDRLKKYAEEAGWELKERGIREAVGNVKERRNFTLYVPVAFLDRHKTFTNSFDRMKSAAWCKDFIEEIGYWDSHKRETGSVVYYTTNKDNADFVADIAILAGYRVVRNVNVDNRKESYKDVHVVNITMQNWTDAQLTKYTKAEGAHVYGVEVPTTYLLVRRDNKVVVSGNSVHAKSYSSIFSTLCSMQEIDELYEWVNSNPWLQFKKNAILEQYNSEDTIMLRAASVALESMLFYSGFYMPMYWLSRKKLTNTADIIKLIIADESIHGYYIGYKFRQEFNKLSKKDRLEYFAKINKLFLDLYDNEMKFIEEVYSPIGLVEDVKKFVNTNFNKSFQNMGFEVKFSGERINVSAAVMSALGRDATHDFFSQSGSSYEVAVVEEMDFDDWGDMFGEDD